MIRVAAGLMIAALGGGVLPGVVAEPWGTRVLVLAWLTVADLVLSGLIGHCPLHRIVRFPWDPGVRG